MESNIADALPCKNADENSSRVTTRRRKEKKPIIDYLVSDLYTPYFLGMHIPAYAHLTSGMYVRSTEVGSHVGSDIVYHTPITPFSSRLSTGTGRTEVCLVGLDERVFA